MLILDTNHFSEIGRDNAIGHRLHRRIAESDNRPVLSVITLEESMKGWLAQINPHRQPDRGVEAYAKFQQGVESFAEWLVLPWIEAAADIFDELRARRVRIGTLDLRIASIALAFDATLLTRNLADFRQVPGLRVENWLD